MIYKQLASTCEQVRVTFELPSCLWADRIYVTGDFNQWQHNATPLKQDREGTWRAVVDLPVGRRFQFRYLIDGKWQIDQAADGSCPNELGGENSLLDTSLLAVETRRETPPARTLVNIPRSRQLHLVAGNGATGNGATGNGATGNIRFPLALFVRTFVNAGSAGSANSVGME